MKDLCRGLHYHGSLLYMFKCNSHQLHITVSCGFCVQSIEHDLFDAQKHVALISKTFCWWWFSRLFISGLLRIRCFIFVLWKMWFQCWQTNIVSFMIVLSAFMQMMNKTTETDYCGVVLLLTYYMLIQCKMEVPYHTPRESHTMWTLLQFL